jgi:hypothetical protein
MCLLRPCQVCYICFGRYPGEPAVGYDHYALVYRSPSISSLLSAFQVVEQVEPNVVMTSSKADDHFMDVLRNSSVLSDTYSLYTYLLTSNCSGRSWRVVPNSTCERLHDEEGAGPSFVFEPLIGTSS